MITKDKVTEFFCIVDEFNKNLDSEMQKISYYRPDTMTVKDTGTAKADCPKAR